MTMTPNDYATLFLAVFSVLLTTRFNRKSEEADRKSEEADAEHQEIVKKLTELEWIARTQKAEILVFFETKNVVNYQVDRSGNRQSITNDKRHYFVVKNIGNVEAKNITISIDPVPHGSLNIQTINVLASRIELSYSFFGDHAAGKDYTGTWSWANPDGSWSERKSDLRLTQ